MLASYPASILNHVTPRSGIPSDSFKVGNALVSGLVFTAIRAANTKHITNTVPGANRDLLPDSDRRPVSMMAISNSMRLPYGHLAGHDVRSRYGGSAGVRLHAGTADIRHEGLRSGNAYGSPSLVQMYIDDFAGTSPELLPETYLAGDLEGWGVVERVTGGLQQRFTVKAQGTWEEAARILHFVETWTFDDGRQDTLSWRIGRRWAGATWATSQSSRVRPKVSGPAAPSTGVIRATRRRKAESPAPRRRWC